MRKRAGSLSGQDPCCLRMNYTCSSLSSKSTIWHLPTPLSNSRGSSSLEGWGWGSAGAVPEWHFLRYLQSPWEMLTRNSICSLTSVFTVENLSEVDLCLFVAVETRAISKIAKLWKIYYLYNAEWVSDELSDSIALTLLHSDLFPWKERLGCVELLLIAGICVWHHTPRYPWHTLLPVSASDFPLTAVHASHLPCGQITGSMAPCKHNEDSAG